MSAWAAATSSRGMLIAYRRRSQVGVGHVDSLLGAQPGTTCRCREDLYMDLAVGDAVYDAHHPAVVVDDRLTGAAGVKGCGKRAADAGLSWLPVTPRRRRVELSGYQK